MGLNVSASFLRMPDAGCLGLCERSLRTCSGARSRPFDAAAFSSRGSPMSRAMGLTSDIRGTKQLHLSPSDLTELIVSLGGVKFWIVSVAPLYIGWVLAHAPAQRHLFIDDLRVVLGIIVVGPLLGTFTLLLDRKSTRLNSSHLG